MMVSLGFCLSKSARQIYGAELDKRDALQGAELDKQDYLLGERTEYSHRISRSFYKKKPFFLDNSLENCWE